MLKIVKFLFCLYGKFLHSFGSSTARDRGIPQLSDMNLLSWNYIKCQHDIKKICLSKNKLNLLFNYCTYATYLGRVVLVCKKVPGHQSLQEPSRCGVTWLDRLNNPQFYTMIFCERKKIFSIWTVEPNAVRRGK